MENNMLDNFFQKENYDCDIIILEKRRKNIIIFFFYEISLKLNYKYGNVNKKKEE